MLYNTAAIRELLKVVFDDQELMIFCYDHFRPVYDKFASEMSRLWKIQLLIDYCERYNQFDELLTQVRDLNPEQYTKFISSIKGPPQTSKIGISFSKSQVEITLRGDLSNFTPELQSAAVGALAGMLNIPRDQISVLQVQVGSIILRLKMPTKAADQLIALYEANDPTMQDMGIQQVRIIHRQVSQTAASIFSSLPGKSKRARLAKHEKLPIEYPISTALTIYIKRLGIFLAVVLVNFLLLGLILIFKHSSWLTIGILLIAFAILLHFRKLIIPLFHKDSIGSFAYNLYGNIIGSNEWSSVDYDSDEDKEDNGFYQKQDQLREDNNKQEH